MNPKGKNPVTLASMGLRHCLWTVLTAALFSSSCTRTITTKKRTYSISGSGAGSEKDDSTALKKRYTSGFSIGKDGTMQSNKKDLYTDKSFRNTKDKDIDLKPFRSGKKDLDIKEYSTPEYLTRQKGFRTKDSKFYKDARESDVDRFTTSDSDEEARIRNTKPGFLDWLNPFSNKKPYRGAEKTYRTSTNRAGERAIKRAPSPQPMSEIGASPLEQRNPALSMDDVKKMLNPESFRLLNR